MESDGKMDQFNQIEGLDENNRGSFVSTKSASWPIVLGSADDTVTCESSLSPVDSDGDSANPKPALVLRRPSIERGPCEIKISFERKHEIKQVYVRSTARVYEIYCAADRQSMNEYLCTVRCGMAAKIETEECSEKEYLQNMDATTSISPSSNGSIQLLEEEGLKTDSGGNTNEDGWVEIKYPDTSLTEDGDSSRSNKIDVLIERGNQDFYEATAEISDANPCTSVTIRLLSLESRESVYLDEVYVFADPVECDDVDSTTNGVECSTGNSLMSMLVPTLLQLSKSRMSQMSERYEPSSELKNADDVSQDIPSAETFAKIQQETILSISTEQEMGTAKLNCPDQLMSLEVPTQPSNIEDKSSNSSGMNASSYHIGKTLDQLVSRIARIEELCLSFEERMVNPIISMDARLGKVEHQLNLLNEKFQLSQMHPSGIHVPDLSCNGSEVNSFHIDGNTIPTCKTGSLEKDDCLSDKGSAATSSDKPSARDASLVPIIFTAPELSISSAALENDGCLSDEVAELVSDFPSSASVRAHLVPSLVVTAPEFSYGDDEEENDVSISVGSSPHDTLKKPVSIDDALAYALAGFMSSTSMQDPTTDLNPDASKNDYSSECGDEFVVGAAHIIATIETSTEAVAEDGVHDVLLFDSYSEPTVEIIAGHDHVSGEEGARSFLIQNVENQIGQAEKTVAEVETVIAEEVEIGNAEKDASKTLSEVANKVDSSSGETVMKEASDVLLHGILDLPINSVVDYKIPILDVKFASRESSSISSSIEALLTETTEIDVGSSSVQNRDGGDIADQNYSIESSSISTSIEALLTETTEIDVGSSSVQNRDGGDIADQNYSIEPDNVEFTALETSDHLLVDLGHNDLSCLSCNSKGLPHESYECCNQDVSVALL